MVVSLIDPDERVSGAGVEALRAAGIEVDTGQNITDADKQLATYLHHLRTART